MDCATRLEVHHLHWQTMQVMKTMTTITTVMKLFSNVTESEKLNRKKVLATEICQEWAWMDTECQKSASDVENAQAAWLWVIADSVHPATAHGHTKCVDSAGVATSWWKLHWVLPAVASREAGFLYRLVWTHGWCRQVRIAL